MPEMTRDEIKERLKALNDPWLSAAFAARIVTHVLPFLADGVKEGKSFLWFWKHEKRQDYLLKVLRAWQCAWCASRFRIKIGDAAHTSDAHNAAEAARVARAVHGLQAIRAIRKIRAADVDTVFATAAAVPAAYTNYATDAHVATKTYVTTEAHVAAKAAYAAAAVAVDDGFAPSPYTSYGSASKVAINYIYFLEESKEVASFLERQFDNDLKKKYEILLDKMQEWEGCGFDFWVDWFEARLQGEPLDEKTAIKSCLLSEEILAKSPSEINAYLKSLRDKSAGTPLNRVRAIFIGFGAAGKTSLIRVLHGEPVVEGKEKMTPGIDIRDWRVPNDKTDDSLAPKDSDATLTAHLWDFGGQVMAHATHQFFLRSRSLYVLVMDGRTEINANEQAEYWLEHIRAFGSDAPVLLVGNKADQVRISLDMRYLREKYPNIVDFYPVSCTRCENEYKAEFERFRRDFIKQLHEVGMHQILFTKPHFSVLESVRELSPKQTFLSKDKFTELCQKNGIQEKGGLDQEWLLDLLDKLGVIIHFPNLPWRLGSYLLNPRWLTYGVYTLLYAERAQRQEGRLTPQAVIEILSNKTVTDNLGNTLSYKSENCRFILDALKQFEIGFQLDDKEDSLFIPALLPSDTPEHGFNKQDALAFDFSFSGFLPRHLMPGFIVRRNKEIADHIFWRNGVKLRSQNMNAEALAQVDYHERRLSLWVRGKQASRYFSALHDDIMQMLARMPDLQYIEWVRLPGGEKEWRADFRDLLAMEANGKQNYVCKYGTFSLSEILKIMPPDERRAKVVKTKYYIEGDQKMGDNYNIHDINNSNLNVNSHLDNARQLVKTLPQATPEGKNELEDLLTQLQNQLQKVAKDKAEDAEAVAQMTETLMTEAKKEKPNKTLINSFKKTLIDTASTVSEVLPVAKQIAEMVGEFSG